MQQQRTISWLDCDVQRKVHFIQQLMMTLSMTGLKRSSKALPKAKFAPKKGHGHCLVVCCPSDPLKLSESQWNHYIWEVCSANQWVTLKTIMPAASIGQHKGPNASASQHSPHIAQPALQKWSESGYAFLPYSPDLLPTDYYFFKHFDNFLQGKGFHNQQEAENAFQKFVESWSTDFYAAGINKLIFHWQNMCWL